jgi:hypothetical protein
VAYARLHEMDQPRNVQRLTGELSAAINAADATAEVRLSEIRAALANVVAIYAGDDHTAMLNVIKAAMARMSAEVHAWEHDPDSELGRWTALSGNELAAEFLWREGGAPGAFLVWREEPSAADREQMARWLPEITQAAAIRSGRVLARPGVDPILTGPCFFALRCEVVAGPQLTSRERGDGA